jgi:hypothetical protein
MADRDKSGRFQDGHNLPGPGRPSLYDPSMNDQARKLALLGLTDAEVAEFFGVDERTLNNWKEQHPAFVQSLNDGKIKADADVADSLYRRAMGEVVFTERRVKATNGEYEIVRLMQSVPADPGAAKLWLTNRQPTRWRDKQAVELSGPDGGPVQIDATKLSQQALREIMAATDAATEADEG